jgi:hypothetical protein
MNIYILESDSGILLEEFEAGSTVQAVAMVHPMYKGCGCKLYVAPDYFLLELY